MEIYSQRRSQARTGECRHDPWDVSSLFGRRGWRCFFTRGDIGPTDDDVFHFRSDRVVLSIHLSAIYYLEALEKVSRAISRWARYDQPEPASWFGVDSVDGLRREGNAGSDGNRVLRVYRRSQSRLAARRRAKKIRRAHEFTGGASLQHCLDGATRSWR